MLLKEKYLVPTPTLRKLGTFFSCAYCARQAYFMTIHKNENHYYCNTKCFNRCKK